MNEVEARVRATYPAGMADAEIVEIAPRRMWHALVDGEVVGRAEAFRRPDGRTFVALDVWRRQDGESLLRTVVDAVPGALASMVGADEADQIALFTSSGFSAARSELEVAIPVGPALRATAPGTLPGGLVTVPVAATHPVRLCELDEELRSDVPGAEGWVNDLEEFMQYTYTAGFYEPELYRVAVEQTSGAYVGLVRLSRHPRVPRLALLGVTRPWRRRGIARALLHEALLRVAERGHDEVTAEVDSRDRRSRTLLDSMGARTTGEVLELVREDETP
jgi:GNAT superfamily N-acetyltransferase